jgi:hypothetical protein
MPLNFYRGSINYAYHHDRTKGDMEVVVIEKPSGQFLGLIVMIH